MVNVDVGKDFTYVARISDLQNGMMKEFTVHNRVLLLAQVRDQYYAVDGVCPHLGERLAKGKLDGTVITCPRNESKFDLVDGRVIRWTDWTGVMASVSKLFRPPRPLATYPVKIEGENILVQI